MQPLTRQQFQDALKKGLGRAVLQVREHGLGEFEDDLLHAFLHNLVYDTQEEQSRGDYLFFFLDHVSDRDQLRQRILSALLESQDRRDTDQLFALARRFAETGHADAREAIYKRFNRREDRERWPRARHIMVLDGMDGMLHVAKAVGAALRDGSGVWDYWTVFEMVELLGRETVVAALENAGRHDPDIQAFLDRCIAQDVFEPDRRSSADQAEKPPPTLEEVLAEVEQMDKRSRRRLRRVGDLARPEDINAVFERMLRETRREWLRHYLWLFEFRPMPRVDARVVELAMSSVDEQVQGDAIRALSRLAETKVREVGLRLLREQPTAVLRYAIRLFELNYQPGDEDVICAALPAEGDDGSLHQVGRDLIAVWGKNDRPELGKAMAWVYEHTPCSFCRNGAFEFLVKWNLAPAAMVAEAVWDSCSDTRELARKEIGMDQANLGS